MVNANDIANMSQRNHGVIIRLANILVMLGLLSIFAASMTLLTLFTLFNIAIF
jgi:hypothetical protein